MADHLIETPGPDHCPFQVTYEGPAYDLGPWETYPERQGWDQTVLSEESSAPSIPLDYGPYLECWLYFGILHLAFGDIFKQEDFISVNVDQRPHITTRCLHRYTTQAISQGRSKWDKNIAKALDAILSQINKKKISAMIRPEMLYTMLVLIGTLTFAYNEGKKPAKKYNGRTAPHADKAKEWADSLLLSRGWCPSEIARFSERSFLNWLNQAYALQIQRPKIRSDSETHSECSESECAENYIDNDTYTTKHVRPDCACEHVGPNIDQVKKILRKGGTPLIRISYSKGSSMPTLDVLRYSIGRRYIAISHVWSDGLGNLHGNSLPKCQLRMLKDKCKDTMFVSPNYHTQVDVDGPIIATAQVSYHWVGSLSQWFSDSSVLWMDTLCVPRERETRNVAIQGMKKAYENAYRTLILDSELRVTTTANKSKEDIVFRLLNCSGWMRRLWTLQEGLAARKALFVSFADATLNVPEMADKIWRKLARDRYNLCAIAVPTFSYGMWFVWFRTIVYESPSIIETIFDAGFYIGRLSNTHKCSLVAFSWDNVAARATSRDEDRPVILAGVVSLDPGPLLQIRGDPEARMKAFYILLRKFPQGIIFLPGSRYEEDGWGWALKTCRNHPGALQHGNMDDKPALRRSEGLVVSYPSVTIDLSTRMKKLDSDKTEGFLFAVEDTDDGQEDRPKLLNTIYVFQDKVTSGLKPLPAELPTPAISILFADVPESVESLLANKDNHSTRLKCVILSKHREEGKIAFGKFLMQGLIICSSHAEESWDESELSATYIPTIPKHCVKDQLWCVG